MAKIAPIKYPIDLYPQVAKNESAQNALKALQEASAAINEALGKVTDPRALSQAIRSKAATAVKAATTSHGYVHAASESKAKLMREQLKKRSEFEKEIREHVAAQKNPAAAVHQLIAAGDQDGVAAIFRAPSYLSGLDDEAVAALYQRAKVRFTPELAQQEAEADDGVQRLSRAIEVFNKEIARLDRQIAGSDEQIAANLVKASAA